MHAAKHQRRSCPATGLTILLLLALICTPPLQAGDDASGSIPFRIDLSQPYHQAAFTNEAKAWSQSLATRLNYHGALVHFVKTDIPLCIDGIQITGAVYHGVERPQFYYVVEGDAMLRLGYQHPYSPGVNGFSMHRSASEAIIVSLNFQSHGVPFYSGSPIKPGIIEWKGHHWNRFK